MLPDADPLASWPLSAVLDSHQSPAKEDAYRALCTRILDRAEEFHRQLAARKLSFELFCTDACLLGNFIDDRKFDRIEAMLLRDHHCSFVEMVAVFHTVDVYFSAPASTDTYIPTGLNTCDNLYIGINETLKGHGSHAQEAHDERQSCISAPFPGCRARGEQTHGSRLWGQRGQYVGAKCRCLHESASQTRQREGPSLHRTSSRRSNFQ